MNAALRRVHRLFEDLAQKEKDAATAKRRQEERARGRLLSPGELGRLSDELEHIQRTINPLLERAQGIKQAILAHWGHTGVEEVPGSLGNTLIATSFELQLDAEAVRANIRLGVWNAITRRVIKPALALSAGKGDAALRDALASAIRVGKLTVSVTPPSSRRPRSGKTDADDADEQDGA